MILGSNEVKWYMSTFKAKYIYIYLIIYLGHMTRELGNEYSR